MGPQVLPGLAPDGGAPLPTACGAQASWARTSPSLNPYCRGEEEALSCTGASHRGRRGWDKAEPASRCPEARPRQDRARLAGGLTPWNWTGPRCPQAGLPWS